MFFSTTYSALRLALPPVSLPGESYWILEIVTMGALLPTRRHAVHDAVSDYGAG